MPNSASNSLGSADKRKRDTLLDELVSAVDDWAQKETERIDSEVDFMDSVIRARGGAALVDSANVEQGSLLAADSIGFFLRGG